MNSHETEAKVVSAKDLITSLAIEQMLWAVNKVIEKNLFYLCIHIIPKDAVNDAWYRLSIPSTDWSYVPHVATTQIIDV